MSDHFNGEFFYNPSQDTKKSFWKFLRWQFQGERRPWPRWVENDHVARLPDQVQGGEIAVTFVNHATFLVQTSQGNFLTDPVFSDRVSPFSWLGPKRVHRPGVEAQSLPKIHGIFVSHNHYDHMDEPFLRWIAERDRPQFWVPLGDSVHLRGIDRIQELDWHESTSMGSMRAYFLPALHWSGRWTNDRFRTLWGSYLFEIDGLRVYFAGDSGYSSHFKEIRERYGSPDLALLPIGAYEPRWFMQQAHCNPEDAVQAHLDLQARQSVGMHFGTFRLTDEGRDEPLQDLERARKKLGVSENSFHVLKVGETLRLNPKSA